MNFNELLQIVGDEPIFGTGLLLAGDVNPREIRKQLSRWTSSGKLLQLRRSLYCLAPPYQKVIPHPFWVANRLQPGSYVSLQSALAHYGMIPELVSATTSVSCGRPEELKTPFGLFLFRHIQVGWLRGYHALDLGKGQSAFIATPEKALLDLIYLQTGGDSAAYLRELRLQALDRLDLDRLQFLAQESNKPKLARAVEIIRQLVDEEKTGFTNL